MVEYFNRKANISGSYPLGSFNSAFSFTGSKYVDDVATKTLSSDGFFIPLAKLQLNKPRLLLQENVKRAIPVNWDPPSLARYVYTSYRHNAVINEDILKWSLTYNDFLTALLKILGHMSLLQ